MCMFGGVSTVVEVRSRGRNISALVPHVLFNFFGRCYSPSTSSSKIDSSSDGAAIRTGGSNASE